MGPGLQYGYGFMEGDRDGLHSFGHGGGAPGINGDFKIFPESGHVLVVLSNLDPPAAGVIAEFVTARLPRRQGQPAASTSPASTAPHPAAAGAPPSGPNLLENGDFSAGARLWSTLLWPPLEEPREVPSRVESGALCVSVKGGQNVITSWPGAPSSSNRLELVQGKRYRLSFRASTSGPLALRIVAKVGHREVPYTAAVQAPIPVESTPQVFALDFEPDHTDAKAGVAFILSAPRGDAQNDVCFDDISLTGGSS